MKPVEIVEVFYRGRLAGRLADFEDGTLWQYEPDFLESGENLSPWTLDWGPASQKKNDRRFFGLPGVIADALPDSYGMMIMEKYFRIKGLGVPGALDRLAYVGSQGIGALEFKPALPDAGKLGPVDLEELENAGREYLAKKLSPEFSELMRRTGTAGGARPKVLITAQKGERDFRPGFVPGEGNAYWMVKFQAGPEDEETLVEHAYSRLAGACGIRAVQTEIWPVERKEGLFRHLAVRRFDCEGAERIHYLSFCGLMEGQYNGGTTPDYGVFLLAAGRLCENYQEKREALRRCLFNVLVSNLDDHAKNHGFLMRKGAWELSPAFDLTHGMDFHFQGRGMAVAGRDAAVEGEDLRRLARDADISLKDLREDLEKVDEGLARWEEMAGEAGLSPERREEIQAAILSNRKLIGKI